MLFLVFFTRISILFSYVFILLSITFILSGVAEIQQKQKSKAIFLFYSWDNHFLRWDF
ncbi:DUF3953 domain-containing protein [Bacillus cereus]